MSIVVVTPPEPVVSFAEVSKHLVDLPAEDQAYVEALTAAATAWIDGPAGWLGRAIGEQTLEYRGDCWPCRLPFPPSIEVEEAAVAGIAIEGVTVQPDGRLSRPAALGAGEVVILYRAGYATAPAPIKIAIMMLVAQWYTTRAAAVVGATPTEMPFAVDALLGPYRVYA